MIEITQEQPADADAIEALLDEAFGADRFHKRSYSFREGMAPIASLCLVARDGGTLVGTIRYWPIQIGEIGLPALLLGPVAVDAAYRRHGLGATLIRRSLDEAAHQGHRLVILVGDSGYYERFGFQLAAPFGIEMPLENPARVQMLDLSAPANGPEIVLDGTIRHAAPETLAAAA